MFRDILIVFEGQTICPEALAYGREFAVRMDARVTFLMLAHMTFRGKTILGSKRNALIRIEKRAAELLTQASEAFIQQGLEVSSAFRVGEPAQELIKFLADRQPFQAIIWGSSPALPAKGHWVLRVAGNMECPLLSVCKRGRC